VFKAGVQPPVQEFLILNLNVFLLESYVTVLGGGVTFLSSASNHQTSLIPEDFGSALE
jgi:hypothetical protein